MFLGDRSLCQSLGQIDHDSFIPFPAFEASAFGLCLLPFAFHVSVAYWVCVFDVFQIRPQ